MLDFVDVDWNPAAIAAAGPLWVLYEVRERGGGGEEGMYQAARLIVVLYIYGLVQLV